MGIVRQWRKIGARGRQSDRFARLNVHTNSVHTSSGPPQALPDGIDDTGRRNAWAAGADRATSPYFRTHEALQ